MATIQPEGNFYDKYTTGNPIERMLLNNFFKAIKNNLSGIKFDNVLEVGCGEGKVSNFVYNEFSVDIDAFDISEKVINIAKADFDNINFFVNSIYEIKNIEKKYDLVMSIEVMEHMDTPDAAIQNVINCSNKYVLVSVPREPIWRFLNMCRLKYLKDFGNTPGHVQHWSKKQFIKFCQKYAKIIKVSSPLPWTMILLEKYD